MAILILGYPLPPLLFERFSKMGPKVEFSKSGGEIATYTLEITLKYTELTCIFH